MSETKTTIVLKHVGKSLATGQPLEAPAFVVDGNDTIQLPDSETQKAGFSLETDEETLRVSRLFPTMFKQFVVKDGSAVEVDTQTEDEEEETVED